MALDPGHVEARANLAAAYRGAGRLDAALAEYHRVLAAGAADFPELWFNYANALRDAGRQGDAEIAYLRSIELKPDLAAAHLNLADMAHAAGREETAIEHWQAGLALRPDRAVTWRRLVAALVAAGRQDEATRALESGAAHLPSDAWLLRCLADQRQVEGEAETAEALYRRAIAADPRCIEAHNGLGITLAGRGELAAGQAALETALSIDPDHAGALSNLATLYTRRNQLDQAIPRYRRALALDPGIEEAATGLVKSLARVGHCEEAVTVAQAAVARHPNSAECWQALGYALTHQARIAESLDAFAEARRVDPEHVLARLNAAFTSLYSDAFSAEEITALHREMLGPIEQRKAAEDLGGAHPGVARSRPDADRPLRVGYIGQDFRGHPVGYFIESALVHHDRAAIEVFCYADVAAPDAVTERMKTLGHRWRDVYGWKVERLEECIRADGIDVLVDLAGHTAGHTALLLPRRPAPIQALYLGYPCTSGARAVDYVISDPIVSPPELAHLYTERVAALDTCFLCFRPYADAPEVAPTPALASGQVTFGCYNNLPKISPGAIALWSRVLAGVPGSRMILKGPGLDDPPTRERFWRRFEAEGIARDRVTLVGITAPLARFLAEYGRIDIALDSLPYGGGTTTCEALWMGVPVVTLAGRHFFGRMGASILTHAGLPELVSASADEFARIAAGLAADIDGLAVLRAGLRERLRASAVCDGPRYARAMEAAYRGMVQANGDQ